MRENLLADWFQIETGLRKTGKTQPGEDNNGLSSSERTEMKREVVPADWNLLEASLEGEEQLGGIASQHFGIGAAMMIKIDHIVSTANNRIKDIVANAKQDIQTVKKARGTSSDLSVAGNPEVQLTEDIAPVIESEPSLIRQLWQGSGHEISVNEYKLVMDQFSSDTDSDIEDLKLYMNLSCDEEDQRQSNPPSINFATFAINSMPQNICSVLLVHKHWRRRC